MWHPAHMLAVIRRIGRTPHVTPDPRQAARIEWHLYGEPSPVAKARRTKRKADR